MRKKSGFTMVELVMVIIVLGIVASIGADIISNLYTNYLRTRAVNRLQTQTEIALEQIAKRLQYRIKDSVIARNNAGFKSLASVAVNENYKTLEWIGYSNESLRGEGKTPGWSGFIDLDHNSTNEPAKTIFTPGSKLSDAQQIIEALTYDTVDFAIKKPAIIFKEKSTFEIDEYGWDGGVNEHAFKISVEDDETLKLDDFPDEVFEHYYLAHTAYALQPSNAVVLDNIEDFELKLHYNYQPWHGEDLDDGDEAIIAKHVSLFRFKQDGDIIRLKLCLHDNKESGLEDIIVACKERVIY